MEKRIAIPSPMEDFGEEGSWEIERIPLSALVKFEQLAPPLGEYRVVWSYVPLRKYEGVGEICIDLHGKAVALQIEPAQTPEELVKKLQELIKRIEVPLSTAGDVHATEAYIIFKFLHPPHEYLSGYATTGRAIWKLLNDFLKNPMLHFEGKAQTELKREEGYLHFDLVDFVKKTKRGFEYRGLPSAFLINPDVALVVFKAAHNLVSNLLNNGELRYKIEKVNIGSKEIEIPARKYYIEIAGLTEEEYDTFLWFLQNYEDFKYKPINMSWGVERLIYIYFDKRWEWLELTQPLLEKKIKERIEKLGLDGILSVNLYGLSKRYGKVVAGFKSEIYPTIPHPVFGTWSEIDFETWEGDFETWEAYYGSDNRIYVDKFTYGIPHEVRVIGVPEEVIKKLADEIADDVIDKLKQEENNEKKKMRR